MILFWAIAAAMIVVALVFVVPPLLGRGKGGVQSRKALNVAIFRERIADLEEDLAEAAISEVQYRQARAELERDLLEYTSDSGTTRSQVSGRWVAAVAGVAIPLLAIGIYWQLGAQHLIEGVPQQGADRGPSVEEMIAGLAQRMEENPTDPKGWTMLARSYSATGQYSKAAEAYEKAYELLGDEPQIIADYAEAVSMAAGGSMAGRPLELIQQALKLDPNHTKALWLAGVAAYQGGERASAVAIWRKLSALLPPDSEDARIVNESIAEVENELAPGSGDGDTVREEGTSSGQVQVQVALDEALRDKAEPEDTVFVFARALSGSRAPLAAVRLQVKDLPMTVTLDDSQSMMASRPLSSQSEVAVSARVSKSGNAVPRSGDLEGTLDTVSVAAGQPVSLTIDRVIP